ncbi:hypothetical protein NCCP1664_23800 [Zafaria cholistanensis]|uniref:alcohol dehydrogenase n=1 Tax=Zafaria cholistanensis TaxID=1682741 RepID=A0A5A7NSQ6_9MICC|nr:hypothetical protein NCCP1664_23800 [Zafaria cholistanensis]
MRISVAASGVCHADIGTARTPGATPGHEIAGAGADAELGDGVARRRVGDWRVGDPGVAGWFGGSCRHCASCRRGGIVHCPDRKIPGLSCPGGWAESVTVPADALAHIPDGLDVFDTAPMGCAGVTTFNPLCHARLPVWGRVAVFGLRPHGRLTLIGVDGGCIHVLAGLVMNGQSIGGHLTGSAQDTEDAMAFALTYGIRLVAERLPLEYGNEAIGLIRSVAPRFRLVFDTTTTR